MDQTYSLQTCCPEIIIEKNKDKKITGMQISINVTQSTTNIPDCLKRYGLQETMSQDQQLQLLLEYVMQGWPESRHQLPQDIRTHCRFRDDMGVINGVVIKGRHIVIPETLQQQALKQLHINHKGIEKS